MYHVLIFLISCAALYFATEWVIKGVIRVAEFLGWREFVVAFFVIAFAAALPNFFVAISSVLNDVPELAFGDIMGNNLLVLTIVPVLAILFSGKSLAAPSRMVQKTSVFAIFAAVLPLFLVFDGTLSRIDGALLLLFYFSYVFWLFARRERFTKVFDTDHIPPVKEFRLFVKSFFSIIAGMAILFFAAEGIVNSAVFFADYLNIQLVFIGILIVGFGSCIGEFYFTISLARKGETWMVLGNLMGTVVANSALILGIISLVHPIKIKNHFPFIATTSFLVFAALFFYIFLKTDREITKRESLFLFLIYAAFVSFILLFKY